ncbi:(2Fe-2S)-binding protein [Paraclostridium bifermentans]|nr:(2Fe-2S)-binding protein [Paraclostridium bifermentans]
MSEKVCLCKGIIKETIVDAIKNESKRVEAVKGCNWSCNWIFVTVVDVKSTIEKLIEENK